MTAAAVQLAYNPNNIKPGWVAFLIVMALCVATFFLWRSMNTQLGRIRLPQDDKARRVERSRPTPGDTTEADGAPDAAEDDAAEDDATSDEGERPTDPS